MFDNAAITAVVGLAGGIVGALGRYLYVKQRGQLTLDVSDRDELKGIRAEMHSDLKELRIEYKAQVVQSVECQLRNVVLTEENARLKQEVARLNQTIATSRLILDDSQTKPETEV